MLALDDQPIIAQCTPKGSGAIALLRLSGTTIFSLANQFCKLPNKQPISNAQSQTINYGYVVDKNGKTIDQVLFLVMHGPKTFTGQDTLEITCHNNPFIIDAIITTAIDAGARLATEGEFTKRAVLNDKIDLVQAEAINELIHANSQQALKQSLLQLQGSLSSWIANLEKKIVNAIALSEASFEFLDEEDMEFGNQIEELIAKVTVQIQHIKKSFGQQQQIREGIRIALIGSVNAGKSSLFNALLGKDRAIVTSIAGTTRDVIEAGVYRNGNYWSLIDTAGLRKTEDVIEKQGIERSFAESQKADIILLVVDGSQKLSSQEKTIYTELLEKYKNKIILVSNKSDLVRTIQLFEGFEQILVSTKTKHNINQLESLVKQKIKTIFSSIESPFLLNQRQFNLLLSFEKKLQKIVPMLQKKNIAYEIVSIHLQDAIAHLAQLTGKNISEKGMDAVFRNFCVGK